MFALTHCLPRPGLWSEVEMLQACGWRPDAFDNLVATAKEVSRMRIEFDDIIEIY